MATVLVNEHDLNQDFNKTCSCLLLGFHSRNNVSCLRKIPIPNFHLVESFYSDTLLFSLHLNMIYELDNITMENLNSSHVVIEKILQPLQIKIIQESMERLEELQMILIKHWFINFLFQGFWPSSNTIPWHFCTRDSCHWSMLENSMK